MNHTRFPKEDHLPDWASGQQSYEGWSCRSWSWCNMLCTSSYADINTKRIPWQTSLERKKEKQWKLVCALNTVHQSRVQEPLPLGLGPLVRFSFSYASSIIDFQVCSPPSTLQKPSINLPWSFAAAQKLEPSRGRIVQGKSGTKNKKGYCEWPIRFIHWQVMSFWLRVWKSRTELPLAVSWGMGRRKKRKDTPVCSVSSDFHHVSIRSCARLFINSETHCELDCYSYGGKYICARVHSCDDVVITWSWSWVILCQRVLQDLL